MNHGVTYAGATAALSSGFPFLTYYNITPFLAEKQNAEFPAVDSLSTIYLTQNLFAGRQD
jgi:hypothetical protein